MLVMAPRRAPESRFGDLLQAATRVFIAQGYRLTQMSDVAKEMGVAKGTVYLYVKSKEALFAAVLRYADRTPPAVSELQIPLATPGPGVLLGEMQVALDDDSLPGALTKALARKRVGDVHGELDEIIRELYSEASRHRTVIKLIDRCARDHPELSALFYAKGRFARVDMLARYLESRIEKGLLPSTPDSSATARFVVEAVATWAVHIHWDPAPQGIDSETAEELVVRFVLGGLLAT
jgi:AcrR family transcriptional regulator